MRKFCIVIILYLFFIQFNSVYACECRNSQLNLEDLKSQATIFRIKIADSSNTVLGLNSDNEYQFNYEIEDVIQNINNLDLSSINLNTNDSNILGISSECLNECTDSFIANINNLQKGQSYLVFAQTNEDTPSPQIMALLPIVNNKLATDFLNIKSNTDYNDIKSILVQNTDQNNLYQAVIILSILIFSAAILYSARKEDQETVNEDYEYLTLNNF